MSNSPKQPEDPPSEGSSPVDNAPGGGKHGIPAGSAGEQATSWPTDDRQLTETAPARIETDEA